ncbi:MAG: SBBP repeat-containing protein [Candidatus Hermodarchaeota archaeon]
MRKKRLLRISSVLILFNLMILPLWIFNPVVMSQSPSIPETENNNTRISLYSRLKAEDVPLKVVQRQPSPQTARLPFTGFIQNLGQLSDDTIQYYCSMNGLSVGFSSSRITFASKSEEDTEIVSFSVTFPGSSSIIPVGCGKTRHSINYFYGEFQLTNVPTYKEIRYKDLYPGIDLRYYMSNQNLKYDFVVHPGADPNLITVQVSESMNLIIRDQSVSLQSRNPSDCVWFQDAALHVYQDNGRTISSQFIPKTVDSNTYGFQLGSFDPTHLLIIDPLLLIFSTYLGGSDFDMAYDIAVDTDGNSYITGWTYSTDFPVVNPFIDHRSVTYDVFVTKLNATGNGLVFSTYLGGNNIDYAYGIVVDTEGNSYITGETDSSDFPTKNAYQSTRNGVYNDAFVTKLNATGNGLIFSTYLGGTNRDCCHTIRVDAAGNSYITGYTESTDFPTKNAYNNTNAGGRDAFVTKLNATGTGLVFSTYLGGILDDYGYGVAIDTEGNSYIVGATSSSDFPTKNAYNSTHAGGQFDAFVTKLNNTGNGLVFSTFLGGTSHDNGIEIALDATGNIYIVGDTVSDNFPMLNAYDNVIGVEQDAYVAKLNATGTGLVFSTYLGGDEFENVFDIVVDADGNSYIIGQTLSSDFPTYNAYNSTFSGNYDVFITKFNATGHGPGTGLVFSTYLGANESDIGHGIAVDINGNCYITGYTVSSNFPSKNAYNSTHSGGGDAFVAKLFLDIPPSIELISPTNNSIQVAGTVIDLTIIDDFGLSHVFFNWDGTANITLGAPYDVVLPAGAGDHVLRVYANDSIDSWTSATYVFTIEAPSSSTTSSSTSFTTSTTTTTTTDFFTIEIFLLGLVVLSIVLWRKRKHLRTQLENRI